MANIYVRSTDGSDTDNGSTWALAKATLAGAAAIDAAGDTIFVSDAHAQSSAGVAHAWAGTNANPVKILGSDDAAEPPTALSALPTLTASGNTWTWIGGVYTYGLRFIFTTTSSVSLPFNGNVDHYQLYDHCAFDYGSGAGFCCSFGATAQGHGFTRLRDCTFKFNGSLQRIGVNKSIEVEGGSIEAGSAATSIVFDFASVGRGARLLVTGFDMSNIGSGTNLVSQPLDAGGALAVFRDCKLPASWTGAPIASASKMVGFRVELHNCDSGDTNYRLWIEDYLGSIVSETTIVLSGGANDGTTALSWKMVSNTNACYPTAVLMSPEIADWNETTGSAITVTVEVVTDGVTLTDEECWLEVTYLGTSGVPLGSRGSDAKADILATAANQASSTATWTTTGLTSPVKQKLSVTFTPQEKGYYIARVCLAKPSTTVYVDPFPTVS